MVVVVSSSATPRPPQVWAGPGRYITIVGEPEGLLEHSIITCLSWEFVILFDDKTLSRNMYGKQKSLNARLFGS